MGPEGKPKKDPPRSGRGGPSLRLCSGQASCSLPAMARKARLYGLHQRAAFCVKQQENPPVAITPGTIHRHLIHLPQRRSPDAALGYEYAHELPLPIRNWPAASDISCAATHSTWPSSATFASSTPISPPTTRPAPLSGPSSSKHCTSSTPMPSFLANRDLTLWDFVNMKTDAIQLRKGD
jgi:hypothetical protein